MTEYRESLKNTIRSSRERLKHGKTTSAILVEEAFERIDDAVGEGKLTFTKVYGDQAHEAAAEADRLRRSGSWSSPIVGLPISIKDLFDVAGEVTKAGSTVLADFAPAKKDAEIVRRLNQAGAVIVGRTNMSEFAFTGVGINPHYGTPANPFDRQRRRIPGGSSSGAPISVTDGMALAAIGTDTGGSVRIPAALCGLVGFKPTQRRIPRAGVFPLSSTLDSVGVIANTVSCCAEVDAVLAAEDWVEKKVHLSSTTFAIPKNYFLDELDKDVASAFESAISKLSASGAKMIDIQLPEVAQIVDINSRGGISAPEAYAYHSRLETDFNHYDPLVRERILRGKDISAAEYLDMLHMRERLMKDFNEISEKWDALLCPTVPIIAPEIAALEKDSDLFRRTNRLLLRNPSVVNFLDGCALSIPCQEDSTAPVGLMLIGRSLQDQALLTIGTAVERIVTSCS